MMNNSLIENFLFPESPYDFGSVGETLNDIRDLIALITTVNDQSSVGLIRKTVVGMGETYCSIHQNTGILLHIISHLETLTLTNILNTANNYLVLYEDIILNHKPEAEGMDSVFQELIKHLLSTNGHNHENIIAYHLFHAINERKKFKILFDSPVIFYGEEGVMDLAYDFGDKGLSENKRETFYNKICMFSHSNLSNFNEIKVT